MRPSAPLSFAGPLVIALSSGLEAVRAQVAWRRLNPAASPPAVAAGLTPHELAYDEARDRLVYVRVGDGGVNGGRLPLQTWEWDGTTWLQVASPRTPGPRTSFGLVYDGARQRVVLFGGLAGGAGPFLGDTWEWDGTSWRMAATAGPPVRAAPAMVFDADRAEVVLFGGYVVANSIRTHLADTWTWDGVTWTQQAPPAAPPGRLLGRMAFDAERSRVVLFGGNDRALFDDTWEWDGLTWQQAAPATRPAARTGHGLAYDAGRGRVVLYGGMVLSVGSFLRDVWEWDGTNWVGRQTSAVPSGSRYLGLAYDTGREQIILYGGDVNITSASNQTWAYGPTRAGSLTTVGPGCSGSTIGVALGPATALRPYAGSVVRLQLSRLPTVPGFAAVVLGLPLPAPMSLAGVGMPGCWLHADIGLAAGLATSSSAVEFGLPIPADPAVVGAVFSCQALAVAGGANAAGVVASTAVVGVIGAR